VEDAYATVGLTAQLSIERFSAPVQPVTTERRGRGRRSARQGPFKVVLTRTASRWGARYNRDGAGPNRSCVRNPAQEVYPESEALPQ
jgi:hypothetical protein